MSSQYLTPVLMYCVMSRDVLLHMLHVSGARRCDSEVKGCQAGCSPEGNFNGKPDERSKNLFNLDKMGRPLLLIGIL